jgi:hypothetical protein
MRRRNMSLIVFIGKRKHNRECRHVRIVCSLVLTVIMVRPIRLVFLANRLIVTLSP